MRWLRAGDVLLPCSAPYAAIGRGAVCCAKALLRRYSFHASMFTPRRAIRESPPPRQRVFFFTYDFATPCYIRYDFATSFSYHVNMINDAAAAMPVFHFLLLFAIFQRDSAIRGAPTRFCMRCYICADAAIAFMITFVIDITPPYYYAMSRLAGIMPQNTHVGHHTRHLLPRRGSRHSWDT